MDRTTSSEAAEVQLLDGPLAIQHADRGDSAVLLGGGFFVAPDGTWLRKGSDEFFVAVGDPNPDYNAPLFALKNLGFIEVRVVAGPLVNITLHPRNVASAALRSLQQWLLLFQFSSVKLNYLKDRWISEILTTPAQVICRLFEISALEMTEDASFLRTFGCMQH
ncbi:MAG TPA: hypothetical protein VGR70_18870 [Stellaceae bacterium]|nr:hypothetical protein [Stellaceae bacterium]